MAQDTRLCVKCGHEERFSDNEGGTCEVRDVLEQAELGVETTGCGCFCEFPFVACAQCEANARFNEAGGYREMAERCRAYCRRGHKEELAVASDRAANHRDPLVKALGYVAEVIPPADYRNRDDSDQVQITVTVGWLREVGQALAAAQE